MCVDLTSSSCKKHSSSSSSRSHIIFLILLISSPLSFMTSSSSRNYLHFNRSPSFSITRFTNHESTTCGISSVFCDSFTQQHMYSDHFLRMHTYTYIYTYTHTYIHTYIFFILSIHLILHHVLNLVLKIFQNSFLFNLLLYNNNFFSLQYVSCQIWRPASMPVSSSTTYSLHGETIVTPSQVGLLNIHLSKQEHIQVSV